VAGTRDAARLEELALKTMKVTVDQDKCASSGNCVMHAPDVFDQRDDDGVVILLEEDPPAEHADNVRKAEAGCPALAIHIEE
jgi:ferredoxin